MKARRGRSIDTIFVLIIFSIFSFSVLMVLMLGAGIYRNIHDISRDGEDERIALSFVRTKIRNMDNYDSVAVGEFDGNTALFIYQTIGDRLFRTAIYSRDGWIYELFADAGLTLSGAGGMRIAPVESLNFEKTELGLLRVSAGDLSILLAPRAVQHN